MRCDTAGPVVRGADRDAVHGTVAGRGERIPVVVCPAGHRLPVALAVRAAEVTREALPHGQRRRLRRHDGCGRCGEALTMPVRRTERAVTVTDGDDVPVTTLRFDVPTTRCPDCGADQVPVRSQADLAAVIDALFSPPPEAPQVATADEVTPGPAPDGR